MYAIIKTGSKQYRVEKDSVIRVDLLSQDIGSVFETDRVLFLKSGENDYKVGSPFVADAKVTGTVLDHVKGKKIVVFKMKRRKGYRKKKGHRQKYTRIRIDDILC